MKGYSIDLTNAIKANEAIHTGSVADTTETKSLAAGLLHCSVKELDDCLLIHEEHDSGAWDNLHHEFWSCEADMDLSRIFPLVGTPSGCLENQLDMFWGSLFLFGYVGGGIRKINGEPYQIITTCDASPWGMVLNKIKKDT